MGAFGQIARMESQTARKMGGVGALCPPCPPVPYAYVYVVMWLMLVSPLPHYIATSLPHYIRYARVYFAIEQQSSLSLCLVFLLRHKTLSISLPKLPTRTTSRVDESERLLPNSSHTQTPVGDGFMFFVSSVRVEFYRRLGHVFM